MPRRLDAFMTFDNEQRPPQGYRLRDRTPAEMFSGVAGRSSWRHEPFWEAGRVNTISNLGTLGQSSSL